MGKAPAKKGFKSSSGAPYAAAKTSKKKEAKKAASTKRAPIKHGKESSGSLEAVGTLSGLGGIHCVGGTVARNWYKRWDLADGIAKAIDDARRNRREVFFFLVTEALDKSTHASLIRRDGDENVPVLIAVSSHVPPTELAARFSVQLQQDEMFPLSDVGLRWEEASLPGVYFLRSELLRSKRPGSGGWAENEYLMLPLFRPSQILNATPETVETISIKYKGIDIVILDINNIGEEVEDMIEDGDVDASDRDQVIALLRQQKSEDEKRNRDKIDEKKAHFLKMVDSMSKDNTDVLGELESMKISKIYPENIPAPTTNAWMNVETGFRKNSMVNRFIGNADVVYPLM